MEELESVPIIGPERATYMGAGLPSGERVHLAEFLRRNVGVFAWSYEDISESTLP